LWARQFEEGRVRLAEFGFNSIGLILHDGWEYVKRKVKRTRHRFNRSKMEKRMKRGRLETKGW